MFFKFKAYFRFLMHSKNQYGVHSPFIYDLIINCLYDKKKHPGYKRIKEYRKVLQKKLGKKKVNQLGIPSKKSKLLNRLTTYFDPPSVLDYSDTYGLAAISMYAENKAPIHSLNTRETVFPSSFKPNNMEFFTSDLTHQLEKTKQAPPQLIFIGKKYTKSQFNAIFETLIPHTTPDSMVIFDAIYQSKQTAETWEKLKKHKKIKVSLDLYFWGILFFKQDQAEEHFKIRV